MFNNTVFWLIIIVIFVWLGALSWLLFKALGNYNRLTAGVSAKTLSEILNEFLNQDKLTKAQLLKINREIQSVQLEAKNYIQKIGLIRFNPFADTGGDQSFSLALLDAKDNGIVITSLFARTGVRWYIKKIHGGKGVEHELSVEEKEAIKKIRKIV